MDAEKTEKAGILRSKSLQFAVRIVNLTKYLNQEKKEYTLSKQILKSGTSIGANIREAKYAHGKADFIAKLQIALKECYETEYWLELFKNTATISVTEYNQMMLQCNKIRRLLSASVNTAKENQRQAQKMNGSFGT